MTAATEEEKVLLETKHGIPQSHIFSSNDDSFVHSVLESTNSRGVDVVVNFSSDGHSYNRWKCIAEGGSILELRQRDPSGREKLDCSLLGGNRSFYAFDMVTLLQQKPSMAHRSVEPHLPIFLWLPGCYTFEWVFADIRWNFLQTVGDCFGSLQLWIDKTYLSCIQISPRWDQRSVPASARQSSYWSYMYRVSTRSDNVIGQLFC